MGDVSAVNPKHPIDLVGSLKAPVLGLYGGEDTGIPLDTVAAMKAALASGSAGGAALEFVVYPGCAACLPCRLPAELPQGGGRRRLEALPGLVQEPRRGLTGLLRW